MDIYPIEPAQAWRVAPREPISAIGLLSPSGFDAVARLPAFAAYGDYSDWLDAREGVRMSLAFAGVDVEFTPVSLTAMVAWSRLAGGPIDETELDRLAAFALAVRRAPRPAALAALTGSDFEAAEDQLGGAKSFAAWLQRRRNRRAELAAAGFVVFDVTVRLDDFVAWRRCVGLLVSEASLDAYAALTLELLAAE